MHKKSVVGINVDFGKAQSAVLPQKLENAIRLELLGIVKRSSLPPTKSIVTAFHEQLICKKTTASITCQWG